MTEPSLNTCWKSPRRKLLMPLSKGAGKKNVVYKIEGRGELHSKRKNSFGEELSEEEAEDILFKEVEGEKGGVRRRRSFFSELNKIPPPPTNQSSNQDCIRIHAVNCSHNDSVRCNQRNVENLDVTALI
ncbi:hypothetical protein P8452_36855 [Trifolium repens]|nr:hypothetical protein P8452_36855 [Trifolium repens]